MSSIQPSLFLALLLVGLSGCTNTETVVLASADDEEATGQQAQLPGAPLVLELETNRAHLIRLTPGELSEGLGRLVVSSEGFEVTIMIDGGPPSTPPLSLDLPAGLHTVTAICDEERTENLTVSIEAGATSNLRVCHQQEMP